LQKKKLKAKLAQTTLPILVPDSMASPPPKLSIGGLDYKFEEEGIATFEEANLCLYTVKDRKSMLAEQLLSIYDSISKSRKQQAHFDLLSSKIEDPTAVQDTYNLKILIRECQKNLMVYNFDNVFNIIKLDPVTKIPTGATQNLFMEYATIALKDVAASNAFYSTRLKDTEGLKTASCKNLSLTQAYLENHCTATLKSSVLERLDTFPPEEKGGPLYFKIMMSILQDNSQETITYLLNQIKHLKIFSVDAEDVSKICGHMEPNSSVRFEIIDEADSDSVLPSVDVDEDELSLVDEHSIPSVPSNEPAPVPVPTLRTRSGREIKKPARFLSNQKSYNAKHPEVTCNLSKCGAATTAKPWHKKTMSRKSSNNKFLMSLQCDLLLSTL
jgi:hypothetical protein